MQHWWQMKWLNSNRKQGEPRILCKLDLGRAFDCVNGEFIGFTLLKMGLVRDGEMDHILHLNAKVLNPCEW